MSSNIIQSSFASGELSPTLFARVDLTKYHTGAAMMRNFFVDYRSGTSTRPGTKFCNQCLISSKPVRLIPFQSSALVPYMLEFGDFYMRPYSLGNPILEAAATITAITQASPCQVTVSGPVPAVGSWIFISGVGGMTPLNSRAYFLVTAVAGSVVTIADTAGNPINSVGYPAYTSGGTVQKLTTIASPYAAADLALLKYVQVTNTMYITHPNYPPTTLTFVGPTSWVFTTMSFGTTISGPVSVSASNGTAGAACYQYAVTAVDGNGQESIPSYSNQLNNVVNVEITAGTIIITWTSVPGAVSYNIYRAQIGISASVPSGAAFGFQGSATGTTFYDTNVVPDFSQTPPIANNPFVGGNNPGTCCFFQQRLYFGGSTADPQTFWASQPGLYTNFNISDPTQADDSIEDTLVSRQVNTIKNMLPMPGGLVIFTAQGAWQLSSGTGVASTSAVTPINATANPQTYNGSTDLPPIAINYDVLYPQLDSAVIDLTYNIYASIYTGSDISVLSNHLFFGYSLKEWAFAQKPFKIVWAVRNDGTLLSLTYVKEQEMMGWARHDTQGQFMSVATVLENQYDATYVVAKRFVGGQFLQYVERLDDRVSFPYGAEDSWCVDCAVRTILPTPAANLTISSATGTATFTADAAVFAAAAVGDVIRVGGGIANITSITTSQVVQGTFRQPITTLIPNTNLPAPAALGTWTLGRPFSTFNGLDYLNGQSVSILADGGVLPNQTVVAGQITLPNPASKVIAGLGYQKQVQTMPLDLGNERDTIQAKRKKINAVTIRVREARGLLFGNNFNSLTPVKDESPSTLLGSQIPLQTADLWEVWDPAWTVLGQMCFQIDDPLPATILGVIPEINIGDTKGAP